MKIERINPWLNFLSNLGVIAGIVFLAFQIQQDKELAAASLRNDISRQIVDFNQDMASETFGPVLFKAFSGEELSPYEEFVYSRFYTAAFELAENSYFQFKAGLFGNEEIDSVRQQLVRVFQSEKVRDFYEGYKSNLTLEFVEFADSTIVEMQ